MDSLTRFLEKWLNPKYQIPINTVITDQYRDRFPKINLGISLIMRFISMACKILNKNLSCKYLVRRESDCSIMKTEDTDLKPKILSLICDSSDLTDNYREALKYLRSDFLKILKTLASPEDGFWKGKN